MAIQRSLEKFNLFIIDRYIKIFTNNTQVKAFIYNELPKLPQNKRLISWQTYFAHFDFEIYSVKGINNSFVNFLSKKYVRNNSRAI